MVEHVGICYGHEDESEDCREQGEPPADWLEQPIEDQRLVLGTEDIPPGGVIPRHKHLEQDEILLIQTGTAHVTLNDKEYDVHAGGTVFFPAQTWVGLKNIGNDNISLVFIFSAPGFEENMRCGSVPAGQSTPPINSEELKACAHKGHVEFEAFAPVEK